LGSKSQLVIRRKAKDIKEAQDLDAASKKLANISHSLDLAPDAAKKFFEKGQNVDKLTRKEIAAVLSVYYHIEMEWSGKDPKLSKPKLVDLMKETIQKHGIEKMVVNAATPGHPLAAMAPPPAASYFLENEHQPPPHTPPAANAKTTGLPADDCI
jgi:hypothetical protein